MFDLETNPLLGHIEPDDIVETAEPVEEDNTDPVVEPVAEPEENTDEFVPIEEGSKDEENDEPIEPIEDDNSEPKASNSFFGDIEIPESFESPEEELKFYKESFGKVNEKVKSEEFVGELTSKYEDTLLEKEKDVEELKALRDMLNGKPDTFVKIKFKDQLVKGGYDHRLTQDEINNTVYNALSQKFGNNYQDIYDQDDAKIEGTISNKIIQYQSEMLEKIEEFNQVPQQEQQGIDPEEAKKTVYETLTKKGLSEGQVDKFLDKAKTEWNDIVNDPVKLYNVVYMPEIIKRKETAAYEKGKKEALEEIKKVSKNKPVEDNSQKEEAKEENEFDIRAMYGKRR